MTYTDIPGWFDFEDVYSRAVADCPDGGTMVEVGSWLGRSAAFLAGEIKASGKSIRLYCVDLWAHIPHEPIYHPELARDPDVRGRFERNMTACGVRGNITTIQMSSVAASRRAKAQSIDFVFIDAGHGYDDVRADIAAWLPNVRPGGTIAGHDFSPAGHVPVMTAVHEAFSKTGYSVIGNCWVHCVEPAKP